MTGCPELSVEPEAEEANPVSVYAAEEPEDSRTAYISDPNPEADLPASRAVEVRASVVLLYGPPQAENRQRMAINRARIIFRFFFMTNSSF